MADFRSARTKPVALHICHRVHAQQSTRQVTPGKELSSFPDAVPPNMHLCRMYNHRFDCIQELGLEAAGALGRSTNHAEYVAATETTRDILYVKNLNDGPKLPLDLPIRLCGDNLNANGHANGYPRPCTQMSARLQTQGTRKTRKITAKQARNRIEDLVQKLKSIPRQHGATHSNVR